MPVPLLLVGAAIAGVAGIVLKLDGRGRKKTSMNIYTRYRDRYESDVQRHDNRMMKAERDLEFLVQLGQESLTTMKQAVDFLKKAKLKERNLDYKFKVTNDVLEKWEGPTMEVAEVLRGVTKSVTAGAGTAVGVYSAVGTFGSASTGTAISALSGAAAKNATLASLGGGSIAAGGGGMAVGALTLAGLVLGPATLVAGISEESNATKLETEVELKKAEIKVARAQIKQQIERVEIVGHRINELCKSIGEVNTTLQRLLENGNPAKIEDAHKVALAAKSLGELLDTPIVDEIDEVLDNYSLK